MEGYASDLPPRDSPIYVAATVRTRERESDVTDRVRLFEKARTVLLNKVSPFLLSRTVNRRNTNRLSEERRRSGVPVVQIKNVNIEASDPSVTMNEGTAGVPK
jgi:hypothetical protein